MGCFLPCRIGRGVAAGIFFFYLVVPSKAGGEITREVFPMRDVLAKHPSTRFVWRVCSMRFGGGVVRARSCAA